jgi:hypothetical protein
VLLARDSPLRTFHEKIRVNEVTSTGMVDRVIAVVTQTDGTISENFLELQQGNFIAQSAGLCGAVGDYEVVAYAIDDEGPKQLASVMTFSKI